MPSPFPGMDPYLEAPQFWSAFHNRLIVALADEIAPRLRPKYYVEIETRIYDSTDEEGLLIGIPDVVVFTSQNAATQTSQTTTAATLPTPKRILLPMPEVVKERYLEVRDVETGSAIATIEVLSPKNKQAGRGRDAYVTKRHRILGSLTHLIEIDLLRSGQPMSMQGEALDTDYHILVSRSQQRPYADFYGFSLRDPIPNFVLPLRPEDEEPIVGMQPLLDGIYDRAGYDLRINYQQTPPPPTLSESDRMWLAELQFN